MDKNQQIAAELFELVGGRENITFVTHCMTRLRFNLKDESLADDSKVKNVRGVMGIAHSGGQYQLIVGQNVPKVYKAVCELGGFAQEGAIDENLDAPKEKLTLKKIGSDIMNYLSGSMTQLIGPMIAAAMFKTLLVVLGPDMLNVVSAESDASILFNGIYNAFFYFLPVYLGYSAAKKLNCSVPLGMMMGTILLAPDFVNLIGTKESITVYGLLSAPVQSYAQSVLPVLLAVYLMSIVEKFFKRIIPDVLSTVFVPTLTLAVMVPLLFCVCGPIGGYIGGILSSALISFGGFGGFIAVAVVAALWEFMVMTGMHSVLVMFAITTLMQTGRDSFVLVAAVLATWAAYGMALGAFFRQKNKEEKAESLGYFISGILGGVTEPALFGIGMRFKRPFIALMIGGFIGGLYAGLTHVAIYVMGSSNFLTVLGFVAGGNANLINGIIASLLAMFSTAVITYMLGGFAEEDEKEKQDLADLEPVLEI